MTRRTPSPEVFAALTAARAQFLANVQTERGQQINKWGPCQRLPDVPTREYRQGDSVFEHHRIPRADVARNMCQAAAKAGQCSWTHVLIEEVAEAIEEAEVGNTKALEKELIQCAAVISQWIEDIKLREQGK